MRKLIFVLSLVLLSLTSNHFVQAESKSPFEGKWIVEDLRDSEKGSLTLYEEKGKIVGFIQLWNDQHMTLTGYVDPDSGKVIIKTFYNDRDHERLEFKVIDENSLEGGGYTYNEKRYGLKAERRK